MEQIILNLIPKGLPPICHASQYDKGREIRLVIMDGLQGYYFTDETVELEVRKPDNNVVTAAVDVIQGNSYVDIVTTEQMTACEGDNLCELVIYKGDIRVGSLNFKMRIEVDPLKDGIESETEIHNLTTQIQDINEQIVPDMVAEEVANQYDSQNVIFDDAPTENHGTGYAVTSEGVKNALDGKPDNLSDLGDVDISSPTSNQALVYNPETGKWGNGEVSTVGSIDDLDDVDTTGKAEGDSLRYNGTEWVAQPTTVKLTLAEYNALTEKAPNTRYIITDAPALEYTAEDLSYDGGTDTTKQKIEEIETNKANKSALTWTLLGETTGTAEQNLPSDWNEIQVYGMFGGNAQYGFVAHAIKAHLGSNPSRYIQGGADKEGGTDHHIAIWHIENGKIGLNFWRYNNQDYTSTAKLIVYYR